jgi:hypothetical protein
VVGGGGAGGAPAALALEETAAGARTLARVTLPAPLPPGATVTIDVAFETRVPRRYGAFGCDGARCRLMGGFYPMPAHLGPHGWELEAAPDYTDARVTLQAPPGLALVVDGQPVARPPGAPAAPVTVISRGLPYASIVTDRVLRVSTADVAGVRVQYLHRRPRPPGSEDQVLPYVREDTPGLVLDAARGALLFLRDQGLTVATGGAARPLTLIEAPLRHELVQVHGDVVLVSDQVFGIFPLGRLRKYHRFELVRAVFTAVIGAALGPGERPEDRDLAAGVLAAYLMEVYALREFKKIEYARDLLRPFDFIPAVDQLMYAPLVASAASYFGDVDDSDPVRDDVRRFGHRDASPRLIYNKLLDLLGPVGMTQLGRQVLGLHVPLRAAAAAIFGGDLDWFWRQWLGARPRVNYHLDGVRVQPGAAGGVRVTIDVSRQGDDVQEPVEVRVEDRAGGAQTLVWRARGPRQRFDVVLPAALKSVEIDPRGRLLETALGSLNASDDPRYDNRQPRRWRLLYQGLGGLLNVSQLTANFAALFVVKPQHDLRHAVALQLFHTEAVQVGATGTYYWNFGPQADRNSLTSALFGGLSAARLDPSFGLQLAETPQPGWRFTTRVGGTHDSRDYIIDPWRAVGLDLAVGYSLTALDGGQRLSQIGVSAAALRLVELLPGHVLAIEGSAAATFGDLRLPSQLTGAGGPGGLRGFLADELLARAHVMGRLQLRDDYLTALDWNLLHFTTVRALAGTLFADAAAISSCDGYQLSRRNVYTDVGYSFRVLHDAFGVYQQLLSIDLAVPLNRRADSDLGTCLGRAASVGPRPSFVVLITFLPSF